MPMKSEINPLPLMRKLAEAGAQACAAGHRRTRQAAHHARLRFGDELARGQWGIREPKPEAAEVAPDILLVPLAAFDRAGHRIGYGAGYYDMTIARAAREENGHRHRPRLRRPGNTAKFPPRPATSGSISC